MKVLVSVIALCLAVASSAAHAEEEAAADKAATKADTAKPEAAQKTLMPMFKPTNLGAPMTRLGGATRSATGTVPRTEALVPEVPGHTLKAQPVLYWYLAGETDERIDSR